MLLSSLHYISVQSVARHVYQVGKGALMAKMDIKSVFREVPVHPDDRMLLGMIWDGHYYVDGV